MQLIVAGRCWYDIMRKHSTPAPLALGQQLAEWRQPLDEDSAVEEAVMRMLQSVDRYQRRRDQRSPQESCA
jgi:hypothetical protein